MIQNRIDFWAGIMTIIMLVLILWYSFERRISSLEMDTMEVIWEIEIWLAICNREKPDNELIFNFQKRIRALEEFNNTY